MHYINILYSSLSCQSSSAAKFHIFFKVDNSARVLSPCVSYHLRAFSDAVKASECVGMSFLPSLSLLLPSLEISLILSVIDRTALTLLLTLPTIFGTFRRYLQCLVTDVIPRIGNKIHTFFRI